MSLARANYASSPRTRYGSDFFNFGMRANLKMYVNHSNITCALNSMSIPTQVLNM